MPQDVGQVDAMAQATVGLPADSPWRATNPAELVTAAGTRHMAASIRPLDGRMTARAPPDQRLPKSLLDLALRPRDNTHGQLGAPGLFLARESMMVRRRAAPHATLHAADLTTEPGLLRLSQPSSVGAVRGGTSDKIVVSCAELLDRAPHQPLKPGGCKHRTKLSMANGRPALRDWTRDGTPSIYSLGRSPMLDATLAEPPMATRPYPQSFSHSSRASADLANDLGPVQMQGHHCCGIPKQDITGCMQVASCGIEHSPGLACWPHNAEAEDRHLGTQRSSHELALT
mmetsp:Transcript_39785/g.99962  ORF Transcript_39785/g.99962 Transcript_39785/m.99962 type:complete len:286 (+) Transcript_39785:361-1218(+)